MIARLYIKMLVLFLVSSCANDQVDKLRPSASPKSADLQSPSHPADSIVVVEIEYCPAFGNKSFLHLDRRSRTGNFHVDTTTKHNYGVPEPLISFPLTAFNSKGNNNRIWKEPFIRSLRKDKTRTSPTDGMPVWIYYWKGATKDSVYLGNSHPHRVDSVLREQLDFLLSRTKDKPMRFYLHDLKQNL